jgi:acetyltransferase-like isoleucine patch superfamily enzyme
MLTKDLLKDLYLQLDKEMKDSFNRSLPFDEYLFDRFERAKSINAGDGTSVHHSCYIYGNPKIGSHTWVGPFTLLDASGGLTIGDNCSISAGVHIYTHDTVMKRISKGKLHTHLGRVQIGKSCYIGPHSIVSKDVELGECCIVGANSFVADSFPAFSVVVGSPAKLKGKIDFNLNGVPSISWIKQETKEDNLDLFEKKIHELETRISKLEKI